MGAFIYVANPHESKVLLAVVVLASAVIYAGVLVVLRFADHEEVTVIRDALRIRR